MPGRSVPLGIGNHRAHEERAGVLAERRIGELDPCPCVDSRRRRKDQLDLEVVILGRRHDCALVATIVLHRAIWFCETLKLTQIGSSAATLVSCALSASELT